MRKSNPANKLPWSRKIMFIKLVWYSATLIIYQKAFSITGDVDWKVAISHHCVFFKKEKIGAWIIISIKPLLQKKGLGNRMFVPLPQSKAGKGKIIFIIPDLLSNLLKVKAEQNNVYFHNISIYKAQNVNFFPRHPYVTSMFSKIFSLGSPVTSKVANVENTHQFC